MPPILSRVRMEDHSRSCQEWVDTTYKTLREIFKTSELPVNPDKAKVFQDLWDAGDVRRYLISRGDTTGLKIALLELRRLNGPSKVKVEAYDSDGTVWMGFYREDAVETMDSLRAIIRTSPSPESSESPHSARSAHTESTNPGATTSIKSISFSHNNYSHAMLFLPKRSHPIHATRPTVSPSATITGSVLPTIPWTPHTDVDLRAMRPEKQDYLAHLLSTKDRSLKSSNTKPRSSVPYKIVRSPNPSSNTEGRTGSNAAGERKTPLGADERFKTIPLNNVLDEDWVDVDPDKETEGWVSVSKGRSGLYDCARDAVVE